MGRNGGHSGAIQWPYGELMARLAGFMNGRYQKATAWDRWPRDWFCLSPRVRVDNASATSDCCCGGSRLVRLCIELVGRAGSRPTRRFSASSRRSASGQELATGWDRRFGPLMHGLDDLGVVDATQVSRGDREVRVPELALDDDERDPLA